MLVGCPIRDRTWILPRWREHALVALERAIIEPCFLFVVGSDDEDTIKMVTSWPDTEVILIDEPTGPAQRNWDNKDRLTHMAEIRNIMLKRVREIDPDLFLSLDSDMLLDPRAISCMVQVLYSMSPQCWAVGGKASMNKGDNHCPSFGYFLPGQAGIRRFDYDEMLKVDVIMAIKLMTRQAYSVDYSYHESGEDYAWSRSVFSAGGSLWWDGRVTNKHIMVKDSASETVYSADTLGYG